MIAQSDLKLHNALERLNLVLICRFGLSCLGPLVLSFSLKHYVTLGRFGLSCLGPFVLLFSLKHYVTLGRFGLS
jgi:hypothetical protein